jgi:hypothetical protein
MGVGEGHDFSRAVKSFKTHRASAPEGRASPVNGSFNTLLDYTTSVHAAIPQGLKSRADFQRLNGTTELVPFPSPSRDSLNSGSILPAHYRSLDVF